MICWAGFSAWLTSSPRARSLMEATKSLTTGSATSASSSAIRISRQVASMSASESRPLPRRFLKVSARRSESVANKKIPLSQSMVPPSLTAAGWRPSAAEGVADRVGGLGGAGVGEGARVGLLKVEDVDGLRPDRVDVGRAHGEAEGGHRLQDAVQDARAVRRAHLHHRRVPGGLRAYG